MSVFSNVWALSFVVGTVAFTIVYLNAEKVLNFLSKRTIQVQQDILEIMDKLLISHDKKKTKRNLWLCSIALSILVFIALWPNVMFSFVIGTLVFFGSWYMLKKFFLSMWERHKDKVVFQMVEALTIMCNSLKVGLSLGQSMERVIKGYPGALAKEFGLVLNKMKLGQSMEESLEEMAARIQKSDIDMLVSTITILKETGGNLAETFFVMAETIRSRQKMEKKIKALTAQGMMQAKIISALPFILLGVFYMLDKNYIMPLLTTPLGWGFLVVVVILVTIGSVVMKKMVAIKI